MPLCDGGHRTTMFMGFLRARTTSPPEVFERLRRHRRITHRIGDAGVPQVVLQSASIHALASQGKAGAVAKHVDVDSEGQLGNLASSLDHSADTHAPEWLRPLIHEHIGRFGLLFLLQKS